MPGPVKPIQAATSSPRVLGTEQSLSARGNNNVVSPSPILHTQVDDELDLSSGDWGSWCDSILDNTVIVNSVEDNLTPARPMKKGRRSKAESLVFDPNVPNLLNFIQTARGAKRLGGGLVKTPTSVKKQKIKPEWEVIPKTQIMDNCLVALQQAYFVASTTVLDSPSFTMSGDGNNDMAKVLEAINRVEGNLTGIRDDIKKVSDDSSELKALYRYLKQQLHASEANQIKTLEKVNQRLDALEEQYQLHPSNLSADQVRGVIQQQVTELMASTPDNPLALVGRELAVKMSRALEAIDSNERALKKLNVVVNGLDPEALKSPESVKACLRSKFKTELTFNYVKISGQLPMVTITMPSWEAKQELLKGKAKALADTKIYINPDVTLREQRIARHIREVASSSSKESGKKVRYTTQRVLLNEKWFSWDEFNSCITPAQDRPRQQGKNVRNSQSRSSNISPGGSSNHISPHKIQSPQ